MNELDTYFKVDYTNALSKPETVFQGLTYRITILTERLIRLEYSKEGIFNNQLTEQVINRNFPVPEFKVVQDEGYLEITTKYFMLKYSKEKPFEGLNIEVVLLNTDKVWDVKNKEVRNFKTSGAGFINNKPDYVKGLYSVDGFVTLDDSKSMLIGEDGLVVPATQPRFDTYLFMYRRDFGFCLKDYFTLTGFPPLLPRYALGIWWNKSEVYNFNNIQDLVNDFKKNKIPLSVILLDDYWHLKDFNNPERYKTGFTFNRQLFSDPNFFIKFLHDNNIHLGLQIDPSEGIMPHEDAYEDIARNVGLTDRSTIPFNVFDKNLLMNYFHLLIYPLIQKGVDFFWINYNAAKNTIYNRALIHYHFLDSDKTKEKRGIIIANNEMYSSHRYSIFHSGPTQVAWSTLKTLPYFNSMASNKGLSWWSHDIGGYEGGMEEAELYMRYVQLGCFSPIFRLSSKKGKYYKREPWKWDVKTLNIVREYSQLRHRLLPYLYTENYKYHIIGLPLIEPLYYTNPELYDEPEYKNEYHFGTELLVAPITSRKDQLMNRTVEKIYLPAGMWYDFKTGKKFPGDKRYVAFYKDEDFPVFAKSGSIIPMQELEENLNITGIPNKLEIHIFPGQNNIYKLYEDDGESNLYKDGYYIITAIDYNYLQNNYTVIIHPIEGKNGIIPATRDYKIRFRNTRKADEVIVYQDQDLIEKKTYVEDADFVVEINNVNTSRQLTINCKGQDIEIDAVRLINEDIDSIINDLLIKTELKEELSKIIFGDLDIAQKRIEIRKLRRKGLDGKFIHMFMKLMEYVSEI